jgi:hypothetical protein
MNPEKYKLQNFYCLTQKERHTHHMEHELIHHKVAEEYLDDTLRKLNYTNCRPEPSKTMRTPW